MSFFALVVRNVRRRPGRSLLTAIGVSVGIGALVVLVSLALGFERSWGAVYDASRADLLVGKNTSRRPLPTPFSESLVAQFRTLPEVEEAAAVMTDLLSVDEVPAVLLFGWEPGSFLFNHLRLIDGRWPAAGERAIALGNVIAGTLGKSVGDHVRILDQDYVVSGRFASQAFSENGAAVMTLGELQSATARDGEVNFATLRLRAGAGEGAADEVRRQVRTRFAGFTAETTGEVVRRNVAIQAAKAMSLATSLVALAIGAVGIINTVLMSVIERRREIAVLLALGWRRSRVVKMIVLESTLLSGFGGLGGIAAGCLALWALQQASWFSGKIETSASGWLLAAAVLLSVILGAACGVYPALRGARVPVVEGLHHD
jgi:putative ABC transport system permease protein